MKAELSVPLVALADAIAHDYFFPGGDDDDVRQEARIAAWVAIKSFDPSHDVPFHQFARLVIHRRLKSAVLFANRRKFELLNDSLRQSHTDEGDNFEAVELIIDKHDVCEMAETRETLAAIIEAISGFSPLEREALDWHLNGVPYNGNKQIDNALQRARRKLIAVAA